VGSSHLVPGFEEADGRVGQLPSISALLRHIMHRGAKFWIFFAQIPRREISRWEVSKSSRDRCVLLIANDSL
jgi:hypothetical protein